MRLEDKTGGPAYPVADLGKTQELGLTIRDHFAGQALIGYLTATGEGWDQGRNNPEMVAEWCYQNADAMITERAK